MAVGYPLDYLFENAFGFVLADSAGLFDFCEEIAWGGIFHDDEKVLAVFKNLQQADNVHMHQLLQYENLLQNLHPGEIIFHINFINALDRHQLIRQDLLSEMHLPEASFPQ